VSQSGASRRWSPDRLVLATSGLGSAAIGLLDLFGLLELPALAAKVPQLTLLATGLALTLLSTGVPAWVGSVRKELQRSLSRLEARHEELETSLKELRTAVTSSFLETFPSLIEQVDPALLRIFRPYLEASFRTPPRVLLERRFELQDLESYRSYHRRAHEVNPGATFLATSLPYRKWFWMGDYVERTISSFIATGGTVQRIFFVHTE
jgi:hypothetical protein